MSSKGIGRILWLVLLLSNWSTKVEASVTPALQQAIRSNTFEVVRKKPERDPLKYEKPLPLDLLPYVERTDAYQSIGTAFALGNNMYVTAAHVLIVGVNSQYGTPSLRAPDGSVYAIDRILKFSNDEDFAVFSLVESPKLVGFEVNRSPKIDDPVLAVGNALGEGIVIRDGLFTSETAEEKDGRWKWIRFSAAASPGNSGGPLLDTAGKVIGIVIGKSANENLNFSLPIGQVLTAPNGKARFNERVLTSFPALRGTRTYSYQQAFDLPLNWAEFIKAYEDLVRRHSEQARAALFKAYEDKIFPKGARTESVLFDVDPSYTPRIIVQQADDSWSSVELDYRSADLPGDGSVSVAVLGDVSLRLLRLVRSNNESDDGFYRDSKTFMDIALRRLDVSRDVGPDAVRVTSLGAAVEEILYTDHYGRKWQQRVWPLPFLDAYVVGMLLPTPDGYSALLKFAPSQALTEAKIQANLLTDYVDISYYGTLTQWQAYLKRRELLPAALMDFKLELGQGFALQAKRFMFSVPTPALSVDGNSELGIGMAFMLDDKAAVWDAGAAWLFRDQQRKAYVGMWRQAQPPPTAKLELRNQFSNMRDRRSPYDAQPTRDGSDTFSVSTIIDAPGKTAGMISPDIAYGVSLKLDGRPSLADINNKQALVLNTSRVLERGIAPEVAPTNARSAAASNLAGTESAGSQEFLKFVDEASERYGQDFRGRTFKDDVRDYTLPLMPNQSTSLADARNLSGQFSERMQSLGEYWALVGTLQRARNAWATFLERNRLPAGTPHDASVMALETKLAEVTKQAPSKEWATQATTLTQAYNKERNVLVRSLAAPTVTELSSRQSECPAPSIQTSGSPEPRIARMQRSPDEFYPPDSHRNGEEGSVILEIHVNDGGCATAAAVAGSSGFDSLDKAALKWYESAEFLPAEQNGKAISTVKKLAVSFKMQRQ